MNNKVFVGGLSWNTTEEGMSSAFADCGSVQEVKIILDRETGRSRGFGFVTYGSEEEANRAVKEMDGRELDGRTIRVNIAEQKERRPPRNRY